MCLLLNFNNWISIRVEWIFGYLLKEVEKYFNHSSTAMKLSLLSDAHAHMCLIDAV